MACRYPGAANLTDLWENILTQRQQFRDFPDVRLPLSDYYDADPLTADKTYGRKAALMDGFEFDPGAYRIPKITFETTDIVHWLALSTALEAFKHAGLDRDSLMREKAGVILGNTLTGEETRANTLRLRWPFVRKIFRQAAVAHGLPADGMLHFEATMEQLYKSVFPPITEDTLAGGLANTIAGRICNYLDLHGGGYIVDGACSSSLLAIATAADYLQQDKMDLVIAGGVDVSLDTFELIGFSKATALSQDEMRVYDRRGKGFIPGEGCGMVLLKRLEDARRDGDKVYAVLRGWGVSSDGRGGITAPSAKGQALALTRAYQAAGYAPQTLNFIEGHGTGTAVGDRIELEGIAGALRAYGDVADHAIGMTSFKSIVGHTKAAAGIGGFIKTVIALNRRVIPPTAGCVEPHGSFADVARGLYPVLTGEIHDAREQLRAGVSAMGFGGINCHVTLESGDSPAPELAPSIPEKSLLACHQHSEVIPFSAANLPGLIALVQVARQQVHGLSGGELIDYAAHSAAQLRSLPWRAAVVSGGIDDLEARLDSLEQRLRDNPPGLGELWRGERLWIGNDVHDERIGFLFPGQGSQQVGMARGLVDRFDWAQHFVAQADAEFTGARAGFDGTLDKRPLSALFLNPRERDPANTRESDWMAELTRTEHTQPAICTASWLWMQRLEMLGIKPAVVGGHSLGELTAFAAAGGYNASMLVKLATLRGGVMASQPGGNGGMAAIAGGAETVQGLLDRSGGGYCVIANYNSPRQTVISGECEAVQRVTERAVKEGLHASLLPVSHGFHSRLVELAARAFEDSSEVPSHADPLRYRMFSSIDGLEVAAGLNIKKYLAGQIVSPVNFTRMLEAMSEHCDWFVEVGPGRVLSGLVQSHDAARVRPCMPVESRPGRDADVNAVVAEAFARGIELHWERLYEERLVRPLVTASERKFYVNPCERQPFLSSHQPLIDQVQHLAGALKQTAGIAPLSLHGMATPAQDLARDVIPPTAKSARGVLMGLICERTGFEADTIHDNALLIDDLNLDSIKIGALLADAALAFDIVGKIDLPGLAAANVGAVIAAFDAVLKPDGEEASAWGIMLDLVTKLTGFSRDSLDREQRLLDDLNIDSIKAASLLGDLLLQTGTQTRIEAGALANASLGEIARQVQAAMTAQPAASHKEQSRQATGQQPPARWVRDFCATRVPMPLRGYPSAGAATGIQALLIAPGEVPAFGAALANRLDVQLFLDQPGDAVLSNAPDSLIILLTASEKINADGQCLDGIEQLTLLHRLAVNTPDLWKRINRVAFVQCAGESLPGQAPSPAAWSFAASLSLERPGMEVVVIDFDPALGVDFVVEKIPRELACAPGYHAIEYDAQGERWTRCIAAVEPEECAPRQLSWSSRDVILVTGGGKGITAECVLALALDTGAKFALIGRSMAPAAGEGGELAENLRKLAELGIEYRYYAADVADRQAMAEVIAAIAVDLGTVTGVLHGAGGNTPRRLTDVSAEQARREIAPKLQGAENLLELLESVPLKLFAAFTSIIGVTGMNNNAWYAYSNERVARLLDGFAKAHPATAVVSYAFGVWDSVGMGVKLGSVQHLGKMGIDAIPLNEGVRHFMRWMQSAPPTREVIVTASSSGLATWTRPPARTSEQEALRFTGVVQRHEPGIERVTRVTLNTEQDIYLADHNYRGSLLMPTVMGLEAMAQACLSLVDNPRLQIRRIENIELERPIVVGRERSTVIEIRALALERTEPSDSRAIDVAIHADQTGWGPAHFSARFILGQRGESSEAITPPPVSGLLDIIPSVDLYGGVLFQGPLFQRISAIEALDEQHVVFITESRADTINAPEGFSEDVRAPLVLGDPYYRDTLLQAAQLSLTPEICLPIRIGGIDLYSTKTIGGCYRAEARITGRQDRNVMGEVTVFDREGRLIERISGYEVRVLERRADFPAPAGLIGGIGAREQAAFQADMAHAARTLGFSMPRVILRAIFHAQGHRRPVRRQIMLPLLHAVLRQAMQGFPGPIQGADIQWLDSGKPVVVRDDGELGPLQISLSHDEAMVLCAAGEGPQGCDLVTAIPRTREQWRAMLNAPLFALIEQLEDRGELLDVAGARVWAALEAAIKVFDARDIDLRIDRAVGRVVLFRAAHAGIQARIITFPSRMADGIERLVAVAGHVLGETGGRALPEPENLAMHGNDLPAREESEPAPLASDSWSDWLSAGGKTADFFSIQARFEGDEAERRVLFRFPLAFKDGANLDGSVYFVRLFEWMGRLREMALRPVLGKLAGEFVGGRYAWVTNGSWAHIERPFYAGEIVEVSCRFLGRGGPDNSMVSVGFDWHRVTDKGALEPLATSQIQMTWAKVIAHGVVIPEPYPRYLEHFFQELTDAGETPESRDQAYYRDAINKIGPLDWAKKHGPGVGMPLADQHFGTSINDANLVGNIYYSKYYELQGILRDNYFYNVVPEAYSRDGGGGAIRCLYTEVGHLRDAMPFDTLHAFMYLNAVHKNGMELGFHFFRVMPDGNREKLATGLQVIAWMTVSADKPLPTITALPAALSNRMLNGVSNALSTRAKNTVT
jgi:acyl transferase domain-containing protein